MVVATAREDNVNLMCANAFVMATSVQVRAPATATAPQTQTMVNESYFVCQYHNCS